MHFKGHRLTSQRMIEVKQHRRALVVGSEALHRTGKPPLAVGRRKLHHITQSVRLIGLAHGIEQRPRQPLQFVRVALAKRGARWQLESRTRPFRQTQQARLQRRRQFPRAQRQRGRLVAKGIDQVARRACHAVVQRQKRAWLNAGRVGGHEEVPDKLGSIVKACPMPLKDLPLDAQPREKLLTRGAAALSDAELLALLLRTGIKGKGVLQMADELLQLKTSASDPNQGFDGIAGLLHASADDLKRVKGLGPAKRAELVAVLELARRALAQQLKARTVFATPDAVKHYLQLQLAAKGHEVFAVLFLDVQNRLLATEELFRGTLTQTSVYPREVVLRALHHQAAAVVLAHNHPSGTVQPSRADEALTQTLKTALALIDVRVLDHVIVAPGEALSMAERGLL